MSNVFPSTRSTVDGWIEEILRTKQIDESGLELKSSGDGAIIYKHPKIGQIVITESDIYLGEDNNEEVLHGLGYESDAFLDYLSRQKAQGGLKMKVFSFKRSPTSFRMFRQTQPQYLQ